MAFINNQMHKSSENQQNTMGNNTTPPQQQMPSPYPQYNPNLKACKYCKQPIDKTAKICPFCRKKQGSSVLAVLLIIFIAIFVLPVVVGLGSSNNSGSGSSSGTSSGSSTPATAKVKQQSTCELGDYYVTKGFFG